MSPLVSLRFGQHHVPRVGWYAGLWSALLALSVLVVVLPDIPIAVASPVLAVMAVTAAGVVGLALLQLGILRFSNLGHPSDLFVGLAFGTLGITNLLVRIVILIIGSAAPLETGLYLVLFARIVASVLFLLGLLNPGKVILRNRRTHFGLRVSSTVVVVLLIGSVGIVLLGSDLPDPITPAARQLLEARVPVTDFLPGQEVWLVAVDGFVAFLFLLATGGYIMLSLHHDEPQIRTLVVGLSLLSLSQLHALLFPPLVIDYIRTADVLRLAAYLFLLFGLVAHTGRQISERVSREERLRLSRDLHDGLAQQLSLLNLRLSHASASDRPVERRARDLEAAQRLVEAALLEARQAITSLRTGTVSWEEFARTLGTFADEFAQNHEVEIRLSLEGSVPELTARLQVEVLRVLHEAFSNAIRHGAASEILVLVTVLPNSLRIRIRDNGHGFDPDQVLADGGVGLRSLRERFEHYGGSLTVESALGKGASIHLWVPFSQLGVR